MNFRVIAVSLGALALASLEAPAAAQHMGHGSMTMPMPPAKKPAAKKAAPKKAQAKKKAASTKRQPALEPNHMTMEHPTMDHETMPMTAEPVVPSAPRTPIDHGTM